MREQLNSNEVNEILLDACLDPACFKILYAYMQLGGWKEGQEVYLPMKSQKQWGISKDLLKAHRPHLKSKGFLVPTGNKTELMHDKYLVCVPPVEMAPTLGDSDTDALGDSPPPPALIPPTVGGFDPRKETKSNEVSNQGSKEEVTNPAATASGLETPEVLSEVPLEVSTLGCSDESVASAPSPSSGLIDSVSLSRIDVESLDHVKAPAKGRPAERSSGGPLWNPLELARFNEIVETLKARERRAGVKNKTFDHLHRTARIILDKELGATASSPA